MHFADAIWGVVQIVLLLWLGVIASIKTKAEGLGKIRGLATLLYALRLRCFLRCLKLALVPTLLLLRFSLISL